MNKNKKSSESESMEEEIPEAGLDRIKARAKEPDDSSHINDNEFPPLVANAKTRGLLNMQKERRPTGMQGHGRGSSRGSTSQQSQSGSDSIQGPDAPGSRGAARSGGRGASRSCGRGRRSTHRGSRGANPNMKPASKTDGKSNAQRKDQT